MAASAAGSSHTPAHRRLLERVARRAEHPHDDGVEELVRPRHAVPRELHVQHQGLFIWVNLDDGHLARLVVDVDLEVQHARMIVTDELAELCARTAAKEELEPRRLSARGPAPRPADGPFTRIRAGRYGICGAFAGLGMAIGVLHPTSGRSGVTVQVAIHGPHHEPVASGARGSR